jgi:two-component system KDP operon response regulator KdpE
MTTTPSQPARILVIDDEPQIRRFLDISLRAQGHAVWQADNGRDGLALLATQGADLVVLDLGLPDMDGHEVLRELRGWSAVPVLVLSVRADEAGKVAALDAGANDYVTKPFGTPELMARIRALLRDAAGATQAAAAVYDDGRLRVDMGLREVTLDGQALGAAAAPPRWIVTEPGVGLRLRAVE